MTPGINPLGIVDIACLDAFALASAGKYDEAYLTLNKTSELVAGSDPFLHACLHRARAYVAYRSRDKRTAIREAEKALDLLITEPTEIDGNHVPMSHVSRLVQNVQYISFLAHVSLDGRLEAMSIAEAMLSSGVKNVRSQWTVRETDQQIQKLYRQVLHSNRWNYWFFQAKIRGRKLTYYFA